MVPRILTVPMSLALLSGPSIPIILGVYEIYVCCNRGQVINFASSLQILLRFTNMALDALIDFVIRSATSVNSLILLTQI